MKVHGAQTVKNSAYMYEYMILYIAVSIYALAMAGKRIFHWLTHLKHQFLLLKFAIQVVCGCGHTKSNLADYRGVQPQTKYTSRDIH